MGAILFTDKKRRTGAFRRDGSVFNEQETRTQIEKVVLGKESSHQSIRLNFKIGTCAGFNQCFQITFIKIKIIRCNLNQKDLHRQ